jgi:hypothetical protein
MPSNAQLSILMGIAFRDVQQCMLREADEDNMFPLEIRPQAA